MSPRRQLPLFSLLLFALLAVGLARGHATAAPRATPYRALVPTALRAACPVVDDFSRPHSGWPNPGERGGAYLDGRYVITTSSFSRVAVSRGDRWANSRRLQVTVYEGALQIGQFGLALGMNDDWTDYLAAVIAPADDVLRLIHYDDDVTTPLGEWPFVDTFAAGTVMTVTGDPATGQATLTLNNGALTIPLPDITGGVGFVVGSGRGRGEASFDDYVFIAADCSPAG